MNEKVKSRRTNHDRQPNMVSPMLFTSNVSNPKLKFWDQVDDITYNKMDWVQRGKWILQNNWEVLQEARANPVHNITVVSILMDLDRGLMADTRFRRPFSLYMKRIKPFLRTDLPKFLFLDARYKKELKRLLKRAKGPVHVVWWSKAELRAAFRHFDAVQEIRTDPNWFRGPKASKQSHRWYDYISQSLSTLSPTLAYFMFGTSPVHSRVVPTGFWLETSAQATLEYYNPLVMSKFNLMVHAARTNVFHTDGFLFLDAGHLCHEHQPTSFSQASEKYVASRFLSSGFFSTFFDYHYQNSGEVHGFEARAFQKYLGYQGEQLHGPTVPVGRGGILGGRPEDLELMAQMADMVFEETLSHGYMGTEENIISIISARFPELMYNGTDNRDMVNNCGFFDYIQKQEYQW